ncbi:MAG: type II toxin-antitoxin system VapC family toxin [Vicinamibacterales bacterium]
MTRAFVPDASVAVAWVHPAQATAETAAMLEGLADGTTLAVPVIWPMEVANALLVLVRRRKLADDQRCAALGWLSKLPVVVDHEGAALAFGTLSDLASAHGLSVYDAAYLELAMRRRLPLGCKDGPLRQTARRAGLALWRA